MPSSFWFAANVESRESELTKQALKKKNHYFYSSNMILLRESHLATADLLTMIQLNCMPTAVS